MTSSEWHNAHRLAHIAGGMRASNPPGSEVEFCPRLPGTPCGYSLAEYKLFHKSLVDAGLSLIGVEFVTRQSQIDGRMPTDWRPHHWGAGGCLVYKTKTLWSQLATGGHDTDDYQLVDLCQRISFQIRAASWRLHELSEAYHQELIGRVAEGKFKHGQKFESMSSFFIYLALHSFLSEMTTLRDYLAEFMARYVFTEFLSGSTRVRLMKGLCKQILPNAIGKHPLADTVAKITEEGGWLKTLSDYRDLAVHYTPLVSATHHGFLEQQILKLVGGGEFPAISFPLPTDPSYVKRIRSAGAHYSSIKEWLLASFSQGNEEENGPDALLYCHYSIGKMTTFAKVVGGYAPVKPKMPHFGPHNIIGPIEFKSG